MRGLSWKRCSGQRTGSRLGCESAAERAVCRAVAQYCAAGFPNSGMPPFDLPSEELDAVATFVRSLNSGTTIRPDAGKRVTWGKPQSGDWLTYNGKLSANRYSELKQIHKGNVSALRLKWIFPIPYYGLEVTPLEASGVMYVTGPNQVFAIDALTGNQIWKYSRPQTQGLDGDAALGTNRGVAIREDKVFFETDNAHLLALDRATGELCGRRRCRKSPSIMEGPPLHWWWATP